MSYHTKLDRIPESLKNEIIKRDYQNSFYNFLRGDAHGRWIDGEHLKLIASKLEDVLAGKIRKIIFTMPPRHGKSETITKKFPPWVLLQHPEMEIITSSYSANLAFDFSRVARQTFIDHQDLFNTQISTSNKSVESWGIEGYRGKFTASGVGGPITGKGFHIGIIDDPIKNREEANSVTIREKVWNWYRSVFRTRAYPDASIVIVMTRWHEDDLVGRLLKEQPEEWEVINLPAFAEKNDMIGRKEGEPLWSERYPMQELTNIKKDIGSYEWMALYQQRPTSQGGNIFKQDWFKWVDNVPYESLRIYQNIDLAASSKTESDYFALLTFGIDKQSNIYIFDLYMGHIEFPQQVKIIQQYYQKWNPIRVGVETVAYQNVMEQYLRGVTSIPVTKLKPSTDKVTRALKMTPHFENGKVFISRNLPHRDIFETQLLQFPNGKHDDAVDVVSYISDMMNKSGRANATINIYK